MDGPSRTHPKPAVPARTVSKPNGANSPGKQWLLVENPVAGGGRSRLKEAVALFRAHGIRVDVITTAGRGDARRTARDCPAGTDAIIVAGGDGTINEVVNGLLERPDGPVPLGLLPFGTANVLAGELGIPCRPLPAAQALLSAEPCDIHLGEVNGVAFLVMAGIGLDGRIVARLAPSLKRKLGRLACRRQSCVSPLGARA